MGGSLQCRAKILDLRRRRTGEGSKHQLTPPPPLHPSQIKPQLTPAERAGANGSLLPARDRGAAPRRMTTD